MKGAPEFSHAVLPGKPVPRSFFLRPPEAVAPELIGKLLIRLPDPPPALGATGRIILRITETEAYGADDPASHSFRGPTARNRAMFARGGCVYIYFIYGMHYCLNIVTEEEGRGSAVLLRSAEPLEGQELMAARRFKNRPPEKGGEGLLTCGPGRLAGALGLNREHDGLGLNEGFLLLRDDGWTPPRRLASSPRIGITKAPEKRLRWYLPDSPWVSGQRGGRG